MPEVPINQMSSKQLLVHIAKEVGFRMSELNQHVDAQLAQTEAERQGRLAAEEALRNAQALAEALTANDAEQEAQIADLQTQIQTAIDRLKSDDPQPEAPVEEAPVDEAPADEVDPGTVTDPGTEPTA